MTWHRDSRAVVCVLLLSAAVAATAWAHAFLDHAEPRVGSTAATSPPSVSLSFTEPIEPSFSRIDVSDARGRHVDTGKMEHPAPDRLSATLPPLSAGTYTVHWAVTSVDTHQTEGKFEFTVTPP